MQGVWTRDCTADWRISILRLRYGMLPIDTHVFEHCSPSTVFWMSVEMLEVKPHSEKQITGQDKRGELGVL